MTTGKTSKFPEILIMLPDLKRNTPSAMILSGSLAITAPALILKSGSPDAFYTPDS